jgi:hypothetical protein
MGPGVTLTERTARELVPPLRSGVSASHSARDALGETQRAIATGIGCVQSTVSNYIRVFHDFPEIKKRPPFSEALSAIRGERDHRAIPKAPERRAEIVAYLLDHPWRTVKEIAAPRKDGGIGAAEISVHHVLADDPGTFEERTGRAAQTLERSFKHEARRWGRSA